MELPAQSAIDFGFASAFTIVVMKCARRVEIWPRDLQPVQCSVPVFLGSLSGIDRRAGRGDENLVAGGLPGVS